MVDVRPPNKELLRQGTAARGEAVGNSAEIRESGENAENSDSFGVDYSTATKIRIVLLKSFEFVELKLSKFALDQHRIRSERIIRQRKSTLDSMVPIFMIAIGSFTLLLMAITWAFRNVIH